MGKQILPMKFQRKIMKSPRTGMDWSCVKVILKNGQIFKNVIISFDSEISGVYGHDTIPFKISDIADIIVTHSKDFPKDFKGFQ